MDWDVSTAYYYLDGDRIERDTLYALFDEVEEAAIATYIAYLAQYDGDQFDADSWYEYTQQAVTQHFIYAYLLGRGGRDQMDDDDWAAVAGAVAFQMSYLDGFYNELGDMTFAAIQARSLLYIGAMRIPFFEGLTRAINISGAYSFEYWQLDFMAEHCPDCIAFNSEGWQPLGRWTGRGIYPGSGHTECLGNCRCRLLYR